MTAKMAPVCSVLFGFGCSKTRTKESAFILGVGFWRLLVLKDT